MNLDFYSGKRVFVTGHTGFKGAWLSKILLTAGANVTGFALDPPTDPALFSLLNLSNEMESIIGDVRDYEHLLAAIVACGHHVSSEIEGLLEEGVEFDFAVAEHVGVGGAAP